MQGGCATGSNAHWAAARQAKPKEYSTGPAQAPMHFLGLLAARSLNLTPTHQGIAIMAAQHSQGIQTLLEAEKDAAKVVQEARQYRVKRLKDARTEADEEILAYREAKDQEISAFQSSHAGSTQDAQSIIDKETEEKLGQITDAYDTHKDDVLGKLLDRVVLVQPELHRNLRK